MRLGVLQRRREDSTCTLARRVDPGSSELQIFKENHTTAHRPKDHLVTPCAQKRGGGYTPHVRMTKRLRMLCVHLNSQLLKPTDERTTQGPCAPAWIGRGAPTSRAGPTRPRLQQIQRVESQADEIPQEPQPCRAHATPTALWAEQAI